MTPQSELSIGGIHMPARLNTQAEIHALLSKRRSPRAFLEQSIEPSKILSLFEAARWSPSSANEQPWRFIVATRDDTIPYAALLDSLTEGNRRWAGNAPILVLALAQATYSRNSQPYVHAWYDLGQSVALLSVQATSLGLAVHQMGGFDGGKLRELYPIPDGFVPVIILAVGYPGHSESLPVDLRERERTPRSRKSLESFVFTDQWGEPSRHIQTEGPQPTQPSTN